MTHAELVAQAARWLSRQTGGVKSGCGVVVTETGCQGSEVPDAVGFNAMASYVVECKVSRADFLRDRKKPHREFPEMGIGKFRYYLCPDGMIDADEIPDRWGLLYSVNGKIKVIRKAEAFGDRNDYNMMYSLMRRAVCQGFNPNERYADYMKRIRGEE